MLQLTTKSSVKISPLTKTPISQLILEKSSQARTFTKTSCVWFKLIALTLSLRIKTETTRLNSRRMTMRLVSELDKVRINIFVREQIRKQIKKENNDKYEKSK